MQYVIVCEVTGEAGDFNNNLRNEVKMRFGVRSSKLPAHFTIKAPFEYEGAPTALEVVLEAFAKREYAQPYKLEGYDHFEDRVIYMKMMMSLAGKAMHDRLIEAMGEVPYIKYSTTDGKDKTFHVTVASKHISPIFKELWDYVHDYYFSFECSFNNISLYRWENNTWELYRHYELRM